MAHADEIDPFCDDRGFDEIVGEGTEATLRAEIRSLREELMCEKLAAKAVLDECTEQISHLREQLERVKRDRDLAFRREDTARKFWIRDAKEALIGKPQALRNRIELCELPPVRAEKCPVDGMPLLVFEDEKREQEEKSRADRLAAVEKERDATRARIENIMNNMVMVDIEGIGFAAPVKVANALNVEREIVAHLTQSIDELNAMLAKSQSRAAGEG